MSKGLVADFFEFIEILPVPGCRTLFMAASPIGQSVQNFEAEENSILALPGDSGMDLVVEESCSLKGLS
jgi:hypothetical protein